MFITQADLKFVNPKIDCFIIKNVFDKKFCKQIIKFLNEFSDSYRENEHAIGENWHYTVTSNKNYFQSFIFNELSRIHSLEIVEAYSTLYKIYLELGECLDMSSFKEQIMISDFKTDQRIINPLVFRYFSEKSNFGWHRHDPRGQIFQLVLNLSEPEEDYINGETIVYLGDGIPSLNNSEELMPEFYIKFGNEFKQGDVLSFPYDKWHKVNPVGKGRNESLARTSLLMPLGKRNYNYINEFI